MLYIATWYDPKRVEKEAIKAGWDPNCGDGFLDIYHPDEHEPDKKSFTRLEDAVAFLQRIITDYKDFWGQGRVVEIELVQINSRCRYCTCRGQRRIRTYTVEEEGIVEDSLEDECA